jgi:hypothetical protein
MLRVMWAESLGSLKSCSMSGAKDLLSGDARESEALSGFSLPDVEGSVCGGGEVHGSSCPSAACWLVEFLTDVRQAFDRRRTVGMRGWFGAERRGAGFHAAGGNLLFGWISVHQDISMCVNAESRIGVTAA